MNAISVMLVDDNQIFLRIAERFLQEAAEVIVVGTACEGSEALAKARDLRPQVILLDLNLPDQSGLQIIPQLNLALGEVRIIALTLYDNDGYRQAALAAGADAFVPKKRLGAELLPTIREVMGRATHTVR